jgi:hypothetical protein
MNDVSQSSLLNNAVCDEPFDEIDEIFICLLRIKPPENMVDRIMRAVSLLPQSRSLSQWKNYDFVVVGSGMEHFS